MEALRKFEPLALFLMILGALNWGVIALFDTNVVTEVFTDGTVVDVIYVVFAVSALVWVPRLLEAMHLDRRPHAHGV
jgi:uncharacterized membrane protein YuzA (DUF378 family)